MFLGRLVAVISVVCTETRAGGSPGHLRSIRAFRNLGKAVGVDKVAHGYEQLYGRHLAPVANASEPFKLLEIGLGCTMSYGAGGSVKLWRQWVGEKLELHELEYNQASAKKWASAINVESKTALHVGDQANITDLARLLENAKVTPGQSPVAGCSSCFDAIIDDGGHMPYQNKACFDIWSCSQTGRCLCNRGHLAAREREEQGVVPEAQRVQRRDGTLGARDGSYRPRRHWFCVTLRLRQRPAHAACIASAVGRVSRLLWPSDRYSQSNARGLPRSARVLPRQNATVE